jgi:hypothetical protein
MKVKKAMSDQSALWGASLEFWDKRGVILMIVGGALGFLALGATVASSFILWKVAGLAQSDLEKVSRAHEKELADSKEGFEKYKLDANERISAADARAAEAKKETAELQNQSMKLRMDRGHFFWAYKTKDALQGKPTGRAEVLWLKNASDGEWLARRIAEALYAPNNEPGKGWKIERVVSMDELPKEARPSGVTVIGNRGGNFVFSRFPNAPKSETSLDIVGAALQQGLETDIIDLTYGIDPSLPDDFVRIVIGPKP